MSMTFLNQLGAIPVILITLTCIFILRGEQKVSVTRRFLLFLFGLGVLLQLALFATMRFITEPYNQPFFQLSELLTPSLLGITALILLNLIHMEKMDRKTRIMVGVLGMAMIILFGLLYDFRTGRGVWIVPEALTLIFGWALVWRRDRLMIFLSLLSLVWLGWFYYGDSHPPDFSAGAPSVLYWTLLTFGASNVLLLAVGFALTRRHGRAVNCFKPVVLWHVGMGCLFHWQSARFQRRNTPIIHVTLFAGLWL